MLAFLLDMSVVLLATIVAGVIQIGFALATMFGMHKYLHDKLSATTYGTFDFDAFQKRDFNEMLARLAFIFLAPTILITLVEYLLINYSIRRYPLLICSILVILETAAIGAGFHFLFHLDKRRLQILTAASGVVYIFVLWLVLYYKIS